ncbi:MAG: hypothetical protein KatS3mg027_0063 [Bacteroidia bacterium]|nr:MAG: hypothetical protein KatS3mg027_0063 [Bacteroidia bacterium]
MSVRTQRFSVSIGVWILLYFISLLIVYFNYSLHLTPISFHDVSFFSVNSYVAKGINFLIVVSNFTLISKIFHNRDRGIAGMNMGWVYLMMQNKIWFMQNVNQYLVNDFIILAVLLFINPQEIKKRLNIFVFYLAMFFSIGFLLGVHFMYTFIIPILIFNFFLISDWKSWVIFILGFLLPIYFFITIASLLNIDFSLYFQSLLEYTMYKVMTFRMSNFEVLTQLHWTEGSVLLLTIGLVFISGLKEWQDVNFYSTRERKLALLFFFLMFFSLINYLFIFLIYHQYAPHVIALPFAYYISHFINKVENKLGYFILFILVILTSFF